MILGTGGNGGDGLFACLIDAAGELTVDGVGPARRSRFITGAGIGRRLTGLGAVIATIAVGGGDEQGDADDRAVTPSILPASTQFGVGTQNGPRYTLRFCRAFDGAHLAKRSERGGWRIGIGPEVIAGEIDMLPTER